MTDFLKCVDCSRIIKVIRDGAGTLQCCGKPMLALSTFGSVAGVLDFAIEKEVEARDFYLEWGSKLESEQLRELFSGFAAVEQGHRERLEALKTGGSFVAALGGVTNLKIVDYLVDISPTPDMDYQECLIVAMRREKASMELYGDLAALSPDDATRSLFQSLAKEEAGHKLRLESEYERDIYREN